MAVTAWPRPLTPNTQTPLGNMPRGRKGATPMKCPACDSQNLSEIKPCAVYTCQNCNAIFGQVYLGESYEYVKPVLADVEPPAEDLRYFDFDCVGSSGMTRRHGWYDPATKKIVQIG
jgi:hypothetical protein